MLKKISIAAFSRFVIGYMILAFGWWAYHLWQQNERLFMAEQQMLEYNLFGKNNGANLTRMRETAEYARIEKNWRKGRRMVVAEGLFFTACLVFGLWVIRRSADREVSLAKQRRNFLLSITHELKSPVASLRLTLETILKRNLNEEQRNQLLSNGLKDTDRMQRLVEDLLLAARLEDQWQPLPEPLELEEIVRETVEALQSRFPNAAIKVQITGDRPRVVADRPGITAVVKNLLENALKYSPEASPVVVSIGQSDGKCRIRVADQGQGIPDTEKQRIFEKFYRVGNEDTRKNTGTGLGLFIVKQVVKAHHGNITVANNTPQGTVFTIEL